jgi:hypothetical protein
MDPEQTWHIHLEGETKGPLTTSETKTLLHARKARGETSVWQEGWPAWRTVAEVPDLAWPIPEPAIGESVADLVLDIVGRIPLKWKIAGCGTLFVTVIIMLSSGGESRHSVTNDPEAGFREIANIGQDELRRNDGKPCRICKGSGYGSTARCRQCAGEGTTMTPSGYTMLCTSCGGKGRVPAACGTCGGSGVFRSPF